MQGQTDKTHRLDEIKTKFRAREGYYRLMNSPDYSQRSQRAMGFSTGTANSNSSATNHEKTCIKISLVTVNENNNQNPDRGKQQQQSYRKSRGARDMKICFNVGRELFVYNYDGVKAGPDASNPIYKRFYKGSSPTCHNFNQTTASAGSIVLLVGFSHGQVQLINLTGGDEQESCKEFNSDRLIDKTRVTCLKWLPNSSSLFLVAHASGQMYLYKDDLPCGPTAPIYQTYKQSDGLIVYTCKTKTTRNPIYRWSMGSTLPDNNSSSSSSGSSCSLNKTDNESCSLNEFAFSPCARYIACVSQDGFLRVYCYDTMELVGRARSYYGGLTCVCWSPDGKYVVTGGEDDLITVWSFLERRVVARGLGHKSWVSVVSFDSFYSGYDLKVSDADDYDDEDEDDPEGDDLEDDDVNDDDEEARVNHRLRASNAESKSPSNGANHVFNNSICSNLSSASHVQKSPDSPTSYRLGSVGQDTQICLWDLSDDLLQQPVAKPRLASIAGASSLINITASSCNESNEHHTTTTKQPTTKADERLAQTNSVINTGTLTSKGSSFAKTFSLVSKRDKRNFSLRISDKNSYSKNASSYTNGAGSGGGGGSGSGIEGAGLDEDPTKLLGSSICPRMHEVPLIEPTVCKKISFERLTSLIFCQGGFITSCQGGYVFSWARPLRKMTRTSSGQSIEELRVIDVGTSSAV
uniref:WD repeat-containing protein 20 n=1 Tax=Aceria tosichella TaxID=561515 RepID=A0A6G1SEN2_9ACAR